MWPDYSCINSWLNEKWKAHINESPTHRHTCCTCSQLTQGLRYQSLIRVWGKAAESRHRPLSGSPEGDSGFFGFVSWQMNPDLVLIWEELKPLPPSDHFYLGMLGAVVARGGGFHEGRSDGAQVWTRRTTPVCRRRGRRTGKLHWWVSAEALMRPRNKWGTRTRKLLHVKCVRLN